MTDDEFLDSGGNDEMMARMLQLRSGLLNMTCEDRQFVLSQPGFDGRSSLRQLIHRYLPQLSVECDSPFIPGK